MPHQRFHRFDLITVRFFLSEKIKYPGSFPKGEKIKEHSCLIRYSTILNRSLYVYALNSATFFVYSSYKKTDDSLCDLFQILHIKDYMFNYYYYFIISYL